MIDKGTTLNSSLELQINRTKNQLENFEEQSKTVGEDIKNSGKEDFLKPELGVSIGERTF